MDFTPELYAKTRDALANKITKPCPSCGKENSWTIVQGVGLLRMYYEAVSRFQADAIVPVIITSCNNCGLTLPYNIHTLGLAELLKVPAPGLPIPSPDAVKAIKVEEKTNG
jgi:hypothetical protein